MKTSINHIVISINHRIQPLFEATEPAIGRGPHPVDDKRMMFTDWKCWSILRQLHSLRTEWAKHSSHSLLSSLHLFSHVWYIKHITLWYRTKHHMLLMEYQRSSNIINLWDRTYFWHVLSQLPIIQNIPWQKNARGHSQIHKKVVPKSPEKDPIQRAQVMKTFMGFSGIFFWGHFHNFHEDFLGEIPKSSHVVKPWTTWKS